MRMSATMACVAVLTLWSAPAAAQANFTGTWKIDEAATKLPEKPQNYVIDGDRFACTSCTYPFSVKPDGQFHPITGHPYIDAMEVTLVDDHTVHLRTRKGDKLMLDETDTVQPDGTTLVERGTDMSAPNGTPVHFEDRLVRVGPAPKGHQAAGAWRAEKLGTAEAAALTFTLRVADGRMLYQTPTGEAIDAAIGGPPAPWKGDPGGAMAQVTMPSPATLHLVTLLAGKPVSEMDLQLSPDGAAIEAVMHNLRRGTVTRYHADRL